MLSNTYTYVHVNAVQHPMQSVYLNDQSVYFNDQSLMVVQTPHGLLKQTAIY